MQYRVGGLHYDRATREVISLDSVNSGLRRLTPGQAQLFNCFIDEQELTRESFSHLMRSERRKDGSARELDFRVRDLRHALGPAHERLIQTLPQRGYRLTLVAIPVWTKLGRLPMVIDGDGAIEQNSLSRLMGIANPRIDLHRYAVSELGWIIITSFGDFVSIELDRRRTSRATLIAATDWLMREAGSLAVEIREAGREPTRMDLLATVSFLSDGGANTGLLYETLPIDAAQFGPENVARAYSLWNSASSHDAQFWLSSLREQGISDRLLMAQQSDEGPRWLYIGRSMDVYGEQWRREAIGSPLANQPDVMVGRSIASDYAGIMVTGHPRYDRIRARIQGQRDRRLVYHRFIVPVHTSGLRSSDWAGLGQTNVRAGSGAVGVTHVVQEGE